MAKILHLFTAKRPGQLRGVPWFAPVMTLFKDLADKPLAGGHQQMMARLIQERAAMLFCRRTTISLVKFSVTWIAWCPETWYSYIPTSAPIPTSS